jgi:hypothetical protein
MGFRRSGEKGEGGVRAKALVVDAEAPPKGGSRFSRISKATIRILVDAGSGPIYTARSDHLKQEQWLVAGMEVPVTIDPAQPDGFEVDWEAIPPIEERAAANDPTLADPAGARRKALEALESAGVWGPDMSAAPGGMGELAARSQEAQKAATPDRFAEAMEKAAQEPAPAGKVRAVVRISTIRPKITGGSGPDGSGPSSITTSGKCNAVLSVNVPGQAPYAVYEKKFDSPGDRGDVTGAGLPAVVSSSDPDDVEVLWKELPSLQDAIGQRIADKMQGLQAGMQEETAMQQQMADAIKQAGAAPPAGSAPGAAQAMGQLNPQMKAIMAQNAKRALQFVQDPAQRKMLVDQYRRAGIVIDEDDESP